MGLEIDGKYWHKDKEKDKKRDLEIFNLYKIKIYRFDSKDVVDKKHQIDLDNIIYGCLSIVGNGTRLQNEIIQKI